MAIIARVWKAPENPSPRDLYDLVFGIAKDVAVLSSHMVSMHLFLGGGKHGHENFNGVFLAQDCIVVLGRRCGKGEDNMSILIAGF
jgi:hypothetical protein